MSWLNFNDSLNTIKGQLSSLANGVLTDNIVKDADDVPTKAKTEDLHTLNTSNNLEKNGNNNWTWDTPATSTNANAPKLLQNKIEQLEREKKDLENSLEDLDAEHQQAIDKLVTLKENLQADHNALKSNFEKLQEEYGEVLNENMHHTEKLKKLDVNPDAPNLHEKYIGIITNNIQKYMGSHTDSTIDQKLEDQPELVEFSGKVEPLFKILQEFKNKCEQLEKELCEVTQEKNNTIAEKNFEIEKLLQNSEILSQEVITKSRVIKDYESECGELMKNNDLLITELQNYKNNSGLQTISESNEDNMLLLEVQLENANKRIKDLELIITDLENSKQEANVEVQTELDYIKKQLNLTGQELNQSKEDHQDLLTKYTELQNEKDTFEKIKNEYDNMEYKLTENSVNLETLQEEIEEYKTKIEHFENRDRKLQSINDDFKSKIDSMEHIEKELKEKLQFQTENTNQKELQIINLVERLQNSKMSETGLKLQIDTIYKELQTATEAKQKLEETSKETDELQQTISKLKEELSLVSSSNHALKAAFAEQPTKDSQYQMEIQRLNTIINSQTETKILNDKLLQDIEKLQEQNNILREKCEILAENLLQEQANTQRTIASSDKKELERLRTHLVEIEETYTQELLKAEEKNKEMQTKLNKLEQLEKDSSLMYTSINIRAYQQLETLQNQLQLVTNQRDDLRVKISDTEDENNKHVAALTNLQFVLEQFQKDKDKAVHEETERIRRRIEAEIRIQQDLQKEINNLRLQLDESKQGLQAASRLSDQLESSKKQTADLKKEVTKLQEQLKQSEAKCKELSTQTDTKVDKNLIKNLFIGYITSNVNDQNQILKIIATVLDFNKTEKDKVDLNKHQAGGWLNSILHPQSSNQNATQQSLSEAFIRFLENESKPKHLPNLLNTQEGKTSENSASSSNSTTRQSPLVLSEVVLPTFVDFSKSRNSSSILKDVLKDNNT